MAVAATAGMPLPILVDKLSRGGGSGLERRQLVALTALHRRLPHKSAEGLTTANQLADAGGYSSRWMRVALHELVELGLLEWKRGGVVEGKPAPSWFRVNKARLVELIREGWESYQQLLEQRKAATAVRLRGLWHVRSRTHKPRSHHVEVGSTPPPQEGGSGPAGEPATPAYGVLHVCDHGGDAGQLPDGQPRCPSCRDRKSVV